jgi:hypothetical protein
MAERASVSLGNSRRVIDHLASAAGAGYVKKELAEQDDGVGPSLLVEHLSRRERHR